VSTAVYLNAPARGSSYSTDYGTTWIEIDQVRPKAACRFLNANTGWAGGYFNDNPAITTIPQSGGIYKWDSNSPVAIAARAMEASMLHIYPNPATDKLHVQLPGGSSTHNLRFYNVVGTLVKELNIRASKEVDIADLPVGVYIIRSKNDPRVNLKFVKQ
jgi:hypothetical protein